MCFSRFHQIKRFIGKREGKHLPFLILPVSRGLLQKGVCLCVCVSTPLTSVTCLGDTFPVTLSASVRPDKRWITTESTYFTLFWS